MQNFPDIFDCQIIYSLNIFFTGGDVTWNKLWEMLNILWVSVRVYSAPFVLKLFQTFGYLSCGFVILDTMTQPVLLLLISFQDLLLLSCFSRVQLCATPQTAAHQAPPSMGFSRQEHWSGVPLPSPFQDLDTVIFQPEFLQTENRSLFNSKFICEPLNFQGRFNCPVVIYSFQGAGSKSQ